jgi:uncharacterized GH25 family protein
MRLSSANRSACRGSFAIALLWVSTPLGAHSPYLLPNRFDTGERDHVSVQASFTETFFVPDVVMQTPNYHVVLPDGRQQALQPVYTKDVAILDVDTALSGTYRISSGVRAGRAAKALRSGADWEFLGPDEASAEAREIYAMRSVTVADVFISRGAPNNAALVPRNSGFEFEYLTHPNKVLAGDQLRLRLLHDGRPVARQSVSLRRAASDAGDFGPPVSLLSDAEGKVVFELADAGVYHVMARHRFETSASRREAESHTYAVTIEVGE